MADRRPGSSYRAYLRTVGEAVARLRAVKDQILQGVLTLEPLRARVERLRCFRRDR
ncbi:MAG: hypothetical protein R2712_23025 [Vicinamibacterales bacterium]